MARVTKNSANKQHVAVSTAWGLPSKVSPNPAGAWLGGLFEEAYLFGQLLRTDGARANIRQFLDIGGQTREGELRMNGLNAKLGEAA